MLKTFETEHRNSWDFYQPIVTTTTLMKCCAIQQAAFIVGVPLPHLAARHSLTKKDFHQQNPSLLLSAKACLYSLLSTMVVLYSIGILPDCTRQPDCKLRHQAGGRSRRRGWISFYKVINFSKSIFVLG